MPFVTKEHREHPDPSIPGDRCYRWYKYLVNEWNIEPRWTTADRLYHDIYWNDDGSSTEETVARHLAWQVFFIKFVMPYEDKKENENGAI